MSTHPGAYLSLSDQNVRGGKARLPQPKTNLPPPKHMETPLHTHPPELCLHCLQIQ